MMNPYLRLRNPFQVPFISVQEYSICLFVSVFELIGNKVY